MHQSYKSLLVSYLIWVVGKASARQRNLVQLMAYNLYGREANKYLPSVVPTSSPDDVSYKITALTDLIA